MDSHALVHNGVHMAQRERERVQCVASGYRHGQSNQLRLK